MLMMSMLFALPVCHAAIAVTRIAQSHRLAAPRCCAAVPDITFRTEAWRDSFRGAERAVVISANGDAGGGERLGSLTLEELPVKELAERSEQPRPLLSGLIVQPKHRRRGVARQLVAEAAVQARAWGHDELLLYVESTNVPAVSFYDALGFRNAVDGTRVEPDAEADGEAGAGLLGWARALTRRGQMLCLRKPV